MHVMASTTLLRASAKTSAVLTIGFIFRAVCHSLWVIDHMYMKRRTQTLAPLFLKTSRDVFKAALDEVLS